jgi:hypothetical protein
MSLPQQRRHGALSQRSANHPPVNLCPRHAQRENPPRAESVARSVPGAPPPSVRANPVQPQRLGDELSPLLCRNVEPLLLLHLLAPAGRGADNRRTPYEAQEVRVVAAGHEAPRESSRRCSTQEPSHVGKHQRTPAISPRAPSRRPAPRRVPPRRILRCAGSRWTWPPTSLQCQVVD